MNRPIAILLALGALSTGVVACGDDENDTSGAATSTATQTQATPATSSTGAATASENDLGAVVTGAKDLSKKPEIEITAEFQAEKLSKRDLVTGTGPAAKKGDAVTVRYVGVGFDSEEEFDASWDRPENAFDFTLGEGQVIPGWDQGVVGMKVGGRRLLVIPGDLAYRSQGSPPAIGPNETLAFVVDLRKIK